MSLSSFVAAGIQLGAESLIVKPKRGIFPSDGSTTFIPQATIEERGTDDLDITDHPVEQGANIADHAYKRPCEVVVKMAWSNSPSAPSGPAGLLSAAVASAAANIPAVNAAVNVYQQVQGVLGAVNTITSSQAGSGTSGMNAIYNNLLKLQSGTPTKGPTLCTLYTGRRTYTNMLLKSISFENDFKKENALYLQIVFKQVILVNSVVTTISNASNPASNTSTNQGVKSLSPSTPSFTLPPGVSAGSVA
jgi:hypothetical protein